LVNWEGKFLRGKKKKRAETWKVKLAPGKKTEEIGEEKDSLADAREKKQKDSTALTRKNLNVLRGQRELAKREANERKRGGKGQESCVESRKNWCIERVRARGKPAEQDRLRFQSSV